MEQYATGSKAYADRNLKVAIERFEEAVAKDDSLISPRIMLGKSYYYSGKFEEAQKVFEELIEDFPGNSGSYVWLGRIQMNHSSTMDLAKKNLLFAIQSDDTQIDAHYYLAKVYEQEGNVKDALLEYNKALGIRTKFDRIHRDLGELYKKAGFEDRAEEQLRLISSYRSVDPNEVVSNGEKASKSSKKSSK
ncbi:tetratricopeptide repeat protein [Leptospira perolatii]|nr:tetratricopeptide repeat protein [Leptospira perolatii]